ncbi:carbohydrate kinase family protein [Subtercola frigoramans]|uniref:Sugar/nucleoside kinase (Ribokinase family) n=1 Tax=Subtercola frigoramans TaxID=120298 RepID=A0ABS2L4L4_9MICO|nr:PfkB family carbohydrate kinase [Subtercola frigoramans]MBM7471993.1 sugar/nucleoside kinase (ribokinase family) [Subtercola frigoramans]
MSVPEPGGDFADHRAVRIVTIGDVFDDIIVTPDSQIRPDTDTLARIERRPGGSAANTAAWLGTLGTLVDFVGHTNMVDTVRHSNALRESGVTPHLLGESILPTGTIVVIVGRDDSRTMLTERGANSLTSPHDVSDALLTVASHLHFTGYTMFSGQPQEGFGALIGRAHAHSVTVSIDPGSAGFIADHGVEAFLDCARGADVLFPNLDEGIALTGRADPAEIVDALVERFPVVALTLGRTGALVATRSGLRLVIDCVPAEPLDTTGAGDAFNAGFLAGMFEGLHSGENPFDPGTVGVDVAGRYAGRLQRAGELGGATASRAISAVGARPPGVVSHHHR